jgi:hypothetical protein
MCKYMTATWTYPWSHLGDRATTPFEDLAASGIDAANVASHYHSIRTFDPGGPYFDSFPGGCYFEPDPDHFANVPISPPVNEVSGHWDALGEVVPKASAAGIDVNAWLVCMHNSRLGAENPEYRIQSAFGAAHDHAFCPSNSAVRSYFAGIVRSLSEYDIAEIQLESIGFQGAFHGHGEAFGHDKNQAVAGEAEEILLSQCFCSACRDAAEGHPVAFDRARTVVQRRCRDLLADPAERVTSLSDLCREYPVLADLFDFRAAVVEAFVRELAEASDVPLNYFVADGLGHEPDDGWPAGVVPSRLEPYLDRVTAMCYVDDPAVARRRTEGLGEAVDLPVDAGLTLDPDVIDSRETWREVVESVENRCEQVHVYNGTLMTAGHRNWLADVSA